MLELTFVHVLIIWFVAGLSWGYALFGDGPFIANDFKITVQTPEPKVIFQEAAPRIKPLFDQTTAPKKPKPKVGVKETVQEIKAGLKAFEGAPGTA